MKLFYNRIPKAPSKEDLDQGNGFPVYIGAMNSNGTLRIPARVRTEPCLQQAYY